MLPTAVSYLNVTRDLARSLDVVAQLPQNNREIEYYRENIGKIESIDAFLEDDRLYNFAMRAAGLSDMTYAKAFMRKVLEEGIDDQNSFANSLNDTRYREFAEVFNFNAFGAATTSFTRAGEGMIERYTRQVLEETEGAQNQGVRLALYFERKIEDVDSYLGILADPALAQVVRVGLGLPDSIAAVDLEKQIDLMSARVPFEELKSEAGTGDMLRRFTALWDLTQGSQTQASAGVVFPSATQATFSSDLLFSIQTLKGS
ncbi:MAG: DUF1217 domain-containing protein [Pseudomonadota bacterium]